MAFVRLLRALVSSSILFCNSAILANMSCCVFASLSFNCVSCFLRAFNLSTCLAYSSCAFLTLSVASATSLNEPDCSIVLFKSAALLTNFSMSNKVLSIPDLTVLFHGRFTGIYPELHEPGKRYQSLGNVFFCCCLHGCSSVIGFLVCL